jgi:hypothetical protein
LFPSLADAIARISASWEESIGRNEAGRPDYYVLDFDLAYTYFTFKSDDKYDWDDCYCGKASSESDLCRKCSYCLQYMRDKDEEWVKSHAIFGGSDEND